MEHPQPSKLNAQINAEACDWFIECRAGDLNEAGRRGFDEWLRKSPEHLRAYLEIAAIWNASSLLDPLGTYDLDTLIAGAGADTGNVIALPVARSSGSAGSFSEHHAQDELSRDAHEEDAHEGDAHEAVDRSSRRTGRARPLFQLLAASVAAIAIGGLTWFLTSRQPTYTTAIGEQRSLTLADGSTVTLNARSKIRVRFSKGERGIELLEGQALFQVQKDAARPFVVQSGETRARAVGTEFDVDQKAGGVVVTVIEGRVEVDSETTSSGQPSTLMVSAGEQLVATPSRLQLAGHVNVAGATAWTKKQLVFESASLSEVAEQFNRYNERRLVIRDPALDTFHISGVFSSTDPASLIRFLRTRPGLRVVESVAEIDIEK